MLEAIKDGRGGPPGRLVNWKSSHKALLRSNSALKKRVNRLLKVSKIVENLKDRLGSSETEAITLLDQLFQSIKGKKSKCLRLGPSVLEEAAKQSDFYEKLAEIRDHHQNAMSRLSP